MDVKCQQMWVQEPTFQDMKKWKEYLQRTVENSAKMLKQDDGTRNSEMERMRRNIPVHLLPLPMKPGMESEAGAGSEQGRDSSILVERGGHMPWACGAGVGRGAVPRCW